MTYLPDPQVTTDSRDIAILKAIIANPLEHHNLLKKRLEEKMATRTFDLHIQKLIEEGRILVTHRQNKKFYRVSPITDNESMRQSSKKSLQNSERTVKLLEREYRNMNRESRAEFLLSHIRQLTGHIGMVGMVPCITLDPGDQKLSFELIAGFQKCLIRVFALVRADPDIKDVAAVLFSKVSGISAEDEMQFAKRLKRGFAS